MAQVDAHRVAQALNLSVQRVHQLVKLGMPKETRGLFDPVKCMLFYIRYLQEVLEKQSAPFGDDPQFAGERAQRVRLLSADADLREMELAKQRSLFVTLADVEKERTHLVRTTTARIMAIPSLLAPELVCEMSRVMIQAKIEKSLKQALAYLANEGKERWKQQHIKARRQPRPSA